MTVESDYRVAFTALAGERLAPDAVDRLERALATMPGIDMVDGVERDPLQRRITAIFWIAVGVGMADAARDGSRLAKEALKVAGMADTQLVELAVSLRGERSPVQPGALGAHREVP